MSSSTFPTRLCDLSSDTLGPIMELLESADLARLHLSSASIHHGLRAIRSFSLGNSAFIEKKVLFPTFVAEMIHLQELVLTGNSDWFLHSPPRFWSLLPKSVTSIVGNPHILSLILVTEEARRRHEDDTGLFGVPLYQVGDFEDLELLWPSLKTLDVRIWDTHLGDGLIHKLPRGLTKLCFPEAFVARPALAMLPPHLCTLRLECIPLANTSTEKPVLMVFDEFPASLTSLSMGGAEKLDDLFDEAPPSFVDISLPSLIQLQHLHIDFDYIITADTLSALPPTLTNLGASIGIHNVHALPRQLTHLHARFEQCDISYLRSKGIDTNQDAADVVMRFLPVGLEFLQLYNVPLSKIVVQRLPPHLTHLYVQFKKQLEVNMAELRLPKGLRYLNIKFMDLIVPPDYSTSSYTSDGNKDNYALPIMLETLILPLWSGALGPKILPPNLTEFQSSLRNTSESELIYLSPKLRRLKIYVNSRYKISDRISGMLPRGLQDLTIGTVSSSDHDLSPDVYLHMPPSLTELHCLRFPPINDHSIAALPRQLIKLFIQSEDLNVDLTSEGLRLLPSGLTELSISGKFSSIDGSCFFWLPRGLQVLDMRNLLGVTNRDVATLPRSLRQLNVPMDDLTLECIAGAPVRLQSFIMSYIRRRAHDEDASDMWECL